MIPLILQKLLKKLIASIISIVRRVGQGGWQTAYRSKAAKKRERRYVLMAKINLHRKDIYANSINKMVFLQPVSVRDRFRAQVGI